MFIKRSRRPKRVTNHQRLVLEADAWVRAIVFRRQGCVENLGPCLKCKQIKPLQAAHILSKGAHNSIRFEVENVIGLCLKCHIFWAHRDPVGFTQWMEELYPGRIARLQEIARYHRKIDLKELICVLKSEAK